MDTFLKLASQVYKGISSIYKTRNKQPGSGTGNNILADESMEYADCEPYMPLKDGDVVYVCKVYDGDTVTIAWFDPSIKEGNNRVRIGCRINGIDTPEIRGSSDYEKTLALKAKDRMYKKVMGRFVTIREPALEKYGRVLADLEVGDCDSVKDYMLEASDICKPYNGGTKQEWDG